MKMSQKLIVGLVALCCLGNTVAFSGNTSVRASADTAGEERYYDSYSIMTAATSETVTYDTREVTMQRTVNDVPYYSAQSSSMTNACGAVAGAIMVGFYDKYFENLIPGYTTYFPSLNGRYKPQDSTYIPAAMQELYVLMRTNVEDVGVSKTECLNGLEDYVTAKNLDIDYDGVKSNIWGFNYTNYKNAIDNNKPVMLFCQNLPLNEIGIMDNQDVIGETIISGNHIVIGYGYYEVRYYNGSNNFRTDKYLMVANGQSLLKIGYVDISDDSWCLDGYIVTIS